MTSIDLYDDLIKGINVEIVPSDRESKASQANSKSDQFQILIRQARQLLTEVRENNGDIIRLKDRLMSVTQSDKQNQICSQIKKVCDSSYDKVNELRELLISAGKMVDELKKDQPEEPQTFSKIYRKQHLSEQVNNILNQTFGIQKMVEKYSVQTNLKRIRLILPEATEEQAKRLANSGNGLEQAVASKVTGKVSKKWMYTYKDIMSKNEGIKTLETSVEENLRLMKEVAMLVQAQGEQIDNILKNVEEAKDYVVKAEQVLQKEKELHKTSRKKICCIIFLALAVLALVLTPIIIKVVKSKSQSG